MSCSKLLVLCGSIFIFSINGFANTSYKDFLNAKLLLCSGEADKITQAKTQLDGLLKKNPEDIRLYLLRHFYLGNDGDPVADETAQKIKDKALPSTDFERILFANLAFELKEPGLATISTFLDFHSSNPSLESYRLHLEGLVSEVRGSYPKAYEYFLKSLTMDPDFNPSRLIPFLNGRVGDISSADPSKVAPYLARIKDLDERDPSKTLIQTMVARHNRSMSEKEILENFKKAYEQCPVDGRAAIEYVWTLSYMKYPQRSYDIAKKYVADHKYHSVSWERELANTSLWLKKWDEGESYLKYERETFQFKQSESLRHTIEKYADYSKRMQRFQKIKKVALVAVPLILVGLFFLVYRLGKWAGGRKTQRGGDFPEGTNVQELKAAEDRAYGEKKNYATLKTFNADKGFREADILEMVSYLNSRGIDATYTSSLLYFNQNFSLQVPIDQMKEALEILETYKKA